jgi:hypothetical protein
VAEIGSFDTGEDPHWRILNFATFLSEC